MFGSGGNRRIYSNTLHIRKGANTTKDGKGLIAEDNVAEFTKKGALEGLGEEVGEHGRGVTVAHGDVVLIQAVFDPEMANVDVTRTLACGGATIAGKFDGTFVVLFEETGGEGITLGCHEIVNPDGMGHVVAGTDEFGFGRAFSVDFLFGGAAKDAAVAERGDAASLAAHVGVYAIGSVDEGVHGGEV